MRQITTPFGDRVEITERGGRWGKTVTTFYPEKLKPSDQKRIYEELQQIAKKVDPRDPYPTRRALEEKLAAGETIPLPPKP